MLSTRLGVAGIITGVMVAFAGPSSAARPTTEFYFYDCVGDGPAEFSAVKTTPSPQSPNDTSAGAAYRRTDGPGTYQIVSFGVGNFDPPGIRGSSSGYNLVCQIDFLIGKTTVYGYFASP
jgi:hypothetical protein